MGHREKRACICNESMNEGSEVRREDKRKKERLISTNCPISDTFVIVAPYKTLCV